MKKIFAGLIALIALISMTISVWACEQCAAARMQAPPDSAGSAGLYIVAAVFVAVGVVVLLYVTRPKKRTQVSEVEQGA